jgi:hypothetical protein
LAIEDAAALANTLWTGDLLKAMADTAVMEDMMRHFNLIQLARARSVCQQSEFLTRLQSNNDVVKRLLARYVLPALHDIPAGSSAVVLSGTPRLEFVDIPWRARQQHSGWTLVRTVRAFAPRVHVVVHACGALMAWYAMSWVRKWSYLS